MAAGLNISNIDLRVSVGTIFALLRILCSYRHCIPPWTRSVQSTVTVARIQCYFPSKAAGVTDRLGAVEQI
jgi:hypothetical protein